MNNLQYIFNCLQTEKTINATFIEHNLDEHDKKFYLQEKSSNLVYADNPHDETSIALSTAFFYCLQHSFDRIDFIEIEIVARGKNHHESIIVEPWEEQDEKLKQSILDYHHNIYFRPTQPTIETQSLLQETPFNKFKKNSILLSQHDIETYFKKPYQTHLMAISQNSCLNEHFMARLSQINSSSTQNLLIKLHYDNFNQMMGQYFSQEARFLSMLNQKNDYLIDYSSQLKANLYKKLM